MAICLSGARANTRTDANCHAGVGEEGRGGAAHKGAKKRAHTATRAQHCQWTSGITIYRKRRRLLKINTILLRQCAARQTFQQRAAALCCRSHSPPHLLARTPTSRTDTRFGSCGRPVPPSPHPADPSRRPKCRPDRVNRIIQYCTFLFFLAPKGAHYDTIIYKKKNAKEFIKKNVIIISIFGSDD